MITIHNMYWIISYCAYYWSDSWTDHLLISIPVLMAGIPVLYQRMKQRALTMNGREGEFIPREHHQNYNAADMRVDNVVYKWLDNIGLSQHYNLFMRNGIEDMETIMTLSKEDLSSIGVDKLGHRNKIMGRIRNDNDEQERKLTVSGYQDDHGGDTFYK